MRDVRAALKEFADGGMSLEPLVLLEWRQPWIAVIQPNHKADRHEIRAQHIEPGAAVSIRLQRPADRMPYEAGRVLLLWDLLQFLEGEPLGQMFRQRAPASLGEQRIGGAQFHAGLVVQPFASVFVDTSDAGDDAFHLIVFDNRLRRSEARVISTPRASAFAPSQR
jgi:hypothetical protein